MKNFHHPDAPSYDVLARIAGTHPEQQLSEAEALLSSDEMDRLFGRGIIDALTSKKSLPVWVMFLAAVSGILKVDHVQAQGLHDSAGGHLLDHVDGTTHLGVADGGLAKWEAEHVVLGDSNGSVSRLPSNENKALGGGSGEMFSTDVSGFIPLLGLKEVDNVQMTGWGDVGGNQDMLEKMIGKLGEKGIPVSIDNLFEVELQDTGSVSLRSPRMNMGRGMQGVGPDVETIGPVETASFLIGTTGVGENAKAFAVFAKGTSGVLTGINSDQVQDYHAVELVFAEDGSSMGIAFEDGFQPLVKTDPSGEMMVGVPNDNSIDFKVASSVGGKGTAVERVREIATPTPKIELPTNIVTELQVYLSGYQVKGEQLVDKNGTVIPELKILLSPDGASWEMERVYEYDGDPNFHQPITKESVKVLADGTLDFDCWRYSPERGWIRESYSTADGANIEGKGELLYTAAEMRKFFSNPKNVDMSVTDYSLSEMKAPFLISGYGSPTFKYGLISGPYNRYGFANDSVSVRDESGAYQSLPAGVYGVGELQNNEVTVYFYWPAEHATNSNVGPAVRFGEGGGIIPDDANGSTRNFPNWGLGEVKW